MVVGAFKEHFTMKLSWWWFFSANNINQLQWKQNRIDQVVVMSEMNGVQKNCKWEWSNPQRLMLGLVAPLNLTTVDNKHLAITFYFTLSIESNNGQICTSMYMPCNVASNQIIIMPHHKDEILPDALRNRVNERCGPTTLYDCHWWFDSVGSPGGNPP